MPLESAKESPTRRLIVQTMRSLVSQYGEEKVTVVDVARTLGMSHANVYRFFRSKAEILDAVMDEWLADVEGFIKNLAARPGAVPERLEAVTLAIYRRRRSKYEKDPKMFLAFRKMIEARPDAVAKRRKALFDVFREIFEQAIEAGFFAPIDPVEAAMIFEDATASFVHPLSIPRHPPALTEERLKRVIHVLIAGLAARK
jgi:AcrR family transcriptional regulator